MSSNRIQHNVIATRHYEGMYDSRMHDIKYVATAIIVLLAVSAIALTASCTKGDTISGDAIAGYTVRDNASWAAGTKAAPASSFQHTSFGLFAAAYTGDWDGTASPEYIYNLPVTQSGSTWSTAATYYWPGSRHMRFFAYAPYTNVTDLFEEQAGAPVLTYTLPADLDDQQDLVVASTADLASIPASGYVSLTFQHALSLIGLTARSASGTYNVTDISISVTSHPYRSLSLMGCTWLTPAPAAVKATYNLPDVTISNSQSYITTSNWIAAIPKDDNSAIIDISITYNNNTYDATIENMPLQKGTTYLISSTLHPSSVEFTIDANTSAGSFHHIGSFIIDANTSAGSFHHVATFVIDQTSSGSFHQENPFTPGNNTPGSFIRIPDE